MAWRHVPDLKRAWLPGEDQAAPFWFRDRAPNSFARSIRNRIASCFRCYVYLMRFRTFLGLIPVCAALAQTAQGPEQLAQQMSKLHEVWGPLASSPNVSLAFVEESRSGANFRYTLRATGVPPGAVFTLMSWAVTQRGPTEVLDGVTFDDKGVAICAGRAGTCGDPAVPNDPIHFPFRAVPGEPVRLGIISSDSSIKAFAKIVPLPLQGEDKGCRVSATLLLQGAALLFVEGTGFAPNTEVTMSGNSEGEKHDSKEKVDAQGRFVSALMPAKAGITHGSIKIVVKSASCSPAVSVPWGR